MGDLMNAIQKNEESRIILSTDEGIVEPVSVKGWKDRHGKIHLNEHFARLGSATHSKCQSCGELYPLSSYTICSACIEKKENDKYNNLPYKEWDGIVPLYSDLVDKYFFNADEICDYCYDEDIDISTLKLKICEPNHYREIEEDYWADEMPEDQEDIHSTLKNLLIHINKVIKTLPPLSWSPSKYRTSYDCTPVTDRIIE